MVPRANHQAYWSAQCRAAGGHVEDDGALRMYGPPGSFPINGVLSFPGDADDAVAEAGAWIEDGLPFSFVCDDPGTRRALQDLGLRSYVEYTLMHAPVRDLGDPHHAVEWVNDASAFVAVQGEAHDIPPPARAEVQGAWDSLLAARDVELAVVKDGDTPVGCGALFLAGEDAGLYAVSVLGSHRRQGIATSILRARMRRAKEHGFTGAVGSMTPDGRAFAGAHGFEEAGHLDQLVWFP